MYKKINIARNSTNSRPKAYKLPASKEKIHEKLKVYKNMATKYV